MRSIIFSSGMGMVVSGGPVSLTIGGRNRHYIRRSRRRAKAREALPEGHIALEVTLGHALKTVPGWPSKYFYLPQLGVSYPASVLLDRREEALVLCTSRSNRTSGRKSQTTQQVPGRPGSGRQATWQRDPGKVNGGTCKSESFST